MVDSNFELGFSDGHKVLDKELHEELEGSFFNIARASATAAYEGPRHVSTDPLCWDRSKLVEIGKSVVNYSLYWGTEDNLFEFTPEQCDIERGGLEVSITGKLFAQADNFTYEDVRFHHEQDDVEDNIPLFMLFNVLNGERNYDKRYSDQ